MNRTFDVPGGINRLEHPILNTFDYKFVIFFWRKKYIEMYDFR